MSSLSTGIPASSASDRSVALAALVIAAIGAGALLGAWFFQYGLGLAPCPLCLEQRWPYYIGVPLALLVALAARRGVPHGLLVGALIVLVMLMGAGAGLGVYHAGVEWKWWPGPSDCSGGGFSSGGAGDLLRRMQTTRVVRCDEAAWRDPVTGLSLAGWNVLVSLALVAVAAFGIRAARARA